MHNILFIGRASVFVMPCFVLSHCDLSNYGASRCALGIFRKLSMSGGALTWFDLRLFESTVWKLSMIIELFSQ